MKNPGSNRRELWFWSGVILLVISAFFGLILIPTIIFILAIAHEPVDLVNVLAGGGLITFILIGSGIYCFLRWRPPPVTKEETKKQPSVIKEKAKKQLISRENTVLLGVASIAVGTSTAIIVLPKILVSLLLFALIGGPGVLIGYKLKNIRGVLSGGLGVTAWVYAFVTVGWYGTFNYALLIDSLKTVVPIAVLGTLAFAWLGRKKLAPDRKTLTAFKKLALYTLLIATPFTIAGLHDYNMRADTSPPQVITGKVVDKYTERRGSDPGSTEHYMLKCETLDGSGWFEIDVTRGYYDEHDIGSFCEITVRNGALGYEWLEGYE